ncbi:MAG: GNAT family protein [Pseudomonadota bacterium]
MIDETPFPRPLSAAPLDRLPTGLAPAREPLFGQSVTLEPLDPAIHADDLVRAAEDDDPARWLYLPYGPFNGDRAGLEAHLASCAASTDPLFYAIRPHGPKGPGAAEGVMSYLEIEPTHGIIEIGHIWLGPRLSRTRAATEAMYLTIAHALDTLGYRRMQWKCDALNGGSRAAARRLGFRFEGVLHAVRVVKGRNRDTAYYSILAEEWAEIRPRMEAWLADANFDAAGRPLTSLTEAMAAPRRVAR